MDDTHDFEAMATCEDVDGCPRTDAFANLPSPPQSIAGDDVTQCTSSSTSPKPEVTARNLGSPLTVSPESSRPHGVESTDEEENPHDAQVIRLPTKIFIKVHPSSQKRRAPGWLFSGQVISGPGGKKGRVRMGFWFNGRIEMFDYAKDAVVQVSRRPNTLTTNAWSYIFLGDATDYSRRHESIRHGKIRSKIVNQDGTPFVVDKSDVESCPRSPRPNASHSKICKHAKSRACPRFDNPPRIIQSVVTTGDAVVMPNPVHAMPLTFPFVDLVDPIHQIHSNMDVNMTVPYPLLLSDQTSPEETYGPSDTRAPIITYNSPELFEEMSHAHGHCDSSHDDRTKFPTDTLDDNIEDIISSLHSR